MGQSFKDQHQSARVTNVLPLPRLKNNDELTHKYKDYLAKSAKPTKRGSNPHNLFDDLNCIDKKYLLAVKKFIKMKMLLSNE